MTTEYTLLATIFGPPLELDDLNQLALVLGESTSDDKTFNVINCQHPETGERYCVVSTVVKPVFSEMASKPLIAPDHAPHADIEASTRAQALLSINDQMPSPNHIAVRLAPRTYTTQQHIAEYGLVLIKQEEATP
tara:strand:- start:19694 stop:20098 length:405 start_codon:yes stop_codon:yes gene_type:complete